MDARTNLDRHLRGSRRLDLAGVAWERIPDYPLSAGEKRCLAYMMDIESHTMVFLRDLLCTQAPQDAQLSAFLACWVYEELWHGEALSRFLGHAGVRLEPDADMPRWDASYPSRIARIRRIRSGASGGKNRLTRCGIALASRLCGGLPTVHMAWGAINAANDSRRARPLVGHRRHGRAAARGDGFRGAGPLWRRPWLVGGHGYGPDGRRSPRPLWPEAVRASSGGGYQSRRRTRTRRPSRGSGGMVFHR
jgi:hypothetical protein